MVLSVGLVFAMVAVAVVLIFVGLAVWLLIGSARSGKASGFPGYQWRLTLRHGPQSDWPCRKHPDAPMWASHYWESLLEPSIMTGIPVCTGHRCRYCGMTERNTPAYAQQEGWKADIAAGRAEPLGWLHAMRHDAEAEETP